MIACVETQNGYPAGAPRFAGLGSTGLGDPFTSVAIANMLPGLFANAGGVAANADFFKFAQGTEVLEQQTRQKGILTAGLVVAGLVVGAVVLWQVLK